MNPAEQPGDYSDTPNTLYPAILWEDADIVVIDKPAGLLSLADGYDRQAPHLTSLLAPTYGRLWIVHRLDRETSGVMILARSAEAHHRLNDQFAGRQVRKQYHALVSGRPEWAETEITLPLRKNGDRKHRTVIDPRYGKPASTSCKVIETYGDACLVEAQPHTGYTHQIRAHLTALHLPLLGDTLYGGPLTPLIGRVALHACQIEFAHPTTGEVMHFSAPYPPDFLSAVRMLRSSV